MDINASKYSFVTDDSRLVKPNSIFVAIRGVNADGHLYLENAVHAGASLIVVQKDVAQGLKLPDGVKLWAVDDTKKAFGKIANQVYKLPTNIVGVTGTNGKTSTTYFYKQILEILEIDSASIGTLGVISTKDSEYFYSLGADNTTPGISQVYSTLNKLALAGVDNVAMEVSSHGLHQQRVEGVKFKAAAFTSFTQDHLDYHADMEEYFQAKMKLFLEFLESGSVAVINSDMEVSERVFEMCRARGLHVVTYGSKGDFSILSSDFDGVHTNVKLNIAGKPHELKLPIIGDFQVHNIVCALALAVNTGFRQDKCLKALEKVHPVRGRMEVVAENIIVDYAHTDDALEKAMLSIKRVMKSGKLFVLFGCGGDRDKKKRKLMGEVVQRIADFAIITDDNPRTEDPSSIRQEILKYCTNSLEVEGRGEAIKKAVMMKKKEDFLLIAGKGHEDYQIIGKIKYPFDDAQIVRECLKF
jgi:UDP-N-acetylmuramoyl-L-alanyl-D-glutamate--2,6-diaminopimelate ligase